MSAAAAQNVSDKQTQLEAEVQTLKGRLDAASDPELQLLLRERIAVLQQRVALQQQKAALKAQKAALQQRLALLKEKKVLLMQQQAGARAAGAPKSDTSQTYDNPTSCLEPCHLPALPEQALLFGLLHRSDQDQAKKAQ